MSVWAHPDDEAYLCGGLMAAAVDAGSRVVCVTATRGELGVTDPVRWPPERLAEIREAEMAECLRASRRDRAPLARLPGRRLRVGRILQPAPEPWPRSSSRSGRTPCCTFAPDGQTGHPDHIAVHQWTAEAVRRTGIGTLHVVANTPDFLDAHLARFIEIGAIVGDPPAPWTGPLSIDLSADAPTCWTARWRRSRPRPARPRRCGRWWARSGTGRSSASSGLASSSCEPALCY